MTDGRRLTRDQVRDAAAIRLSDLARAMGVELTQLAQTLYRAIADAIPELRGDDVILALLQSSTEGNVEAYLHMAQHRIPITNVLPPLAAVEYARRLAQRGISANALVRAYRVGQNQLFDLAVTIVAREERDRILALATIQLLQETMFAYVDQVVEHVVAEYESERERWLANRNTVRTAMLTAVLSGRGYDLAAAEAALGYRLRQHHLGIVVWDTDSTGIPSELRRLENLVTAVGELLEATGPALFLPQDGSLSWCWIPLGRTPAHHSIDVDALTRSARAAGAGMRVAIGRPHPAESGFRTTHQEARRAHVVASIAGTAPVTTFSEPGVQISSLLTGDLDATRSLVESTLGGLACDDDAMDQLRDTLLAFLQARSSYVAAAEVVHLHKNTVKYRVDKAVEARGKSLDEDRLGLELALTACHWLGSAVLTSPMRRA